MPAAAGELAHAARLTADSSPTPVELHLFSDLQRAKMPSNFADVVFPANVALVLHPVVDGGLPNWTVETVTAPAQVWGSPRTGKPARVQVVVAGFGTPAATRSVTLVVNGKTMATSGVQVPASGRATVEFASLDVPYGFSRCEVRIDSADGFTADIPVPISSDGIRHVLFHAAAGARSPTFRTRCLSRAIGVRPGAAVGQWPACRSRDAPSWSCRIFPAAGVARARWRNKSGAAAACCWRWDDRGGRSRSAGLQRMTLRAREAGSAGANASRPAALGDGQRAAGPACAFTTRSPPTLPSARCSRSPTNAVVLEDRRGRAVLFASGLDNVTNDALNPLPFIEKAAVLLGRAQGNADDSFSSCAAQRGVPEARRRSSIDGGAVEGCGDGAAGPADTGFFAWLRAGDLIGVSGSPRVHSRRRPASRALWRGRQPQRARGGQRRSAGRETGQPVVAVMLRRRRRSSHVGQPISRCPAPEP